MAQGEGEGSMVRRLQSASSLVMGSWKVTLLWVREGLPPSRPPRSPFFENEQLAGRWKALVRSSSEHVWASDTEEEEQLRVIPQDEWTEWSSQGSAAPQEVSFAIGWLKCPTFRASCFWLNHGCGSSVNHEMHGLSPTLHFPRQLEGSTMALVHWGRMVRPKLVAHAGLPAFRSLWTTLRSLACIHIAAMSSTMSSTVSPLLGWQLSSLMKAQRIAELLSTLAISDSKRTSQNVSGRAILPLT
mmetsp:Transcript_58656/g.104678  ORF Transcript_58656/g.104678 Transcript_58656/m.104678 type:complete len:243 (+) Transcript_58656:206-934(+)